MLILLPPSETKRGGGAVGSRLDLSALRFSELGGARRVMLEAVAALADDEDASVRALKLGPTQRGVVAKNRVLESSPVLAAVDRYTGVLYDALDAVTLPATGRRWLRTHAVIHSALLGPVGALDPIPDYRLSHDSRLPGLRQRAVWAAPVAAVLAAHRGLVVDARSQGYAELGPLPSRANAVTLAVVSEDDSGRRRALNHFNKHAKGELVRALAFSGASPRTVAELVSWGAVNGFRLEGATAGLLTLVTGAAVAVPPPSASSLRGGRRRDRRPA